MMMYYIIMIGNQITFVVFCILIKNYINMLVFDSLGTNICIYI